MKLAKRNAITLLLTARALACATRLVNIRNSLLIVKRFNQLKLLLLPLLLLLQIKLPQKIALVKIRQFALPKILQTDLETNPLIATMCLMKRIKNGHVLSRTALGNSTPIHAHGNALKILSQVKKSKRHATILVKILLLSMIESRLLKTL